MKSSKIFFTSLLAAAAMSAVPAYATSLTDATLSIDAFTSAALTNLGADGWAFSNITGTTSGVYTVTEDEESATVYQGTIGTGTSGATLTTSEGGRYTWSAIFTVNKDAFESSLDGLLLSGMTSTAGSYTGNVGVGVNNGSITGAWQGGSWSNLSIADATTYADASNMVTIGFTFGPNNTGSKLFVLNTDGTTTTIATNGDLRGGGEIVTAVLSNKSGVSYSNLYWFNSKLEESEMTAAMTTVGNGYVWAGTSSANTWNTELANTNWIKDGANVAFASGSSVIFGNAAESKTVAIDSAVTAGTITVLDDYTFTVGSGGSLAGTFSVAAYKTATLNLAAAKTLATNITSGVVKKTGASALTYSGTISSGATLEIAEGGTISVGANGAGTLTGANVFSGTLNNGGTLNISGGVTNVTGVEKLNGNVVIASGATLYSATTDAVTWHNSAASQILNVLGTLHLDARWSMGSGKKIVLSGGTITGTGGGRIIIRPSPWIILVAAQSPRKSGRPDRRFPPTFG